MQLLTRIGDCCCKDYGIYNKLGKLFPRKSLGDKLCKPGKAIIFNPAITALVVIIAYPILCLLVSPFYAISFLLTSPGSWCVFFGLIVLGTRSLARTMIFPGSLKSVQRNVSQEGIFSQFEMFASMSSNMSVQIIGLVSSGNTRNCLLNLEDLTVTCEKTLPRILLISKEGLEVFEPGQDESSRRVLESLCSSGEKLYFSLRVLLDLLKLHTYLGDVVTSKSSELSDATMAVINASSEVNAALLDIKGLIAASSGAQQSGNGTDAYFGNIKSTLVDFFRKDRGLEKVSFPMMRKHISLMFPAHSSAPEASSAQSTEDATLPGGGEQGAKSRMLRMQLKSPEGHVIDAIMVYAHDVDATSASATGEGYPRTDVATVLFCPPNAGFYECLSMSQQGGSWLWYYANYHGINVCVFNYRGYGASTGVPDPTRLQRDGLQVANHLLHNVGVKTLILHGESIGGLVACHIARNCSVSGLVCDRTFASLDAVSRRMLGDWAGLGLNTLGRWQTDSLDNFLCSSCPKTIIQDPDDEIVFHAASLKAGIANRLLLGDKGRGSIPFHARAYRVADALGLPVSLPKDRRSVLDLVDTILKRAEQQEMDVVSPVGLLSTCSEPSLPLTEAFVEHLVACIVSIARRASYDEMQRVRRQMTSQADGTGFDAELGEAIITDNDGPSAEDNTHNPLEAEVVLSPVSAQDREAKGVNSPTPHPTAAAAAGNSEPPVTRGNTAFGGNGRSGGRGRRITGVDKWAQMEGFCSQSIHDPALPMSEKFWLALSRTDGFGGQLLGQAVSGGLDGIRAWVSCCVVWGACGGSEGDDESIPRRDSQLPASRATLGNTIKDFETLISQLRSSQQPHEDSIGAATSGLASESPLSPISESVEFILRAFKVLEIRRKEIARGDVSSLHTAGLLHATQDVPVDPTATSEHRQKQLHIGRLISVHCGHNGFPLKEELGVLSEFVYSITNSSDDIEKMRLAY